LALEERQGRGEDTVVSYRPRASASPSVPDQGVEPMARPLASERQHTKAHRPKLIAIGRAVSTTLSAHLYQRTEATCRSKSSRGCPRIWSGHIETEAHGRPVSNTTEAPCRRQPLHGSRCACQLSRPKMIADASRPRYEQAKRAAPLRQPSAPGEQESLWLEQPR
jgi:hypothetical protein